MYFQAIGVGLDDFKLEETLLTLRPKEVELKQFFLEDTAVRSEKDHQEHCMLAVVDKKQDVDVASESLTRVEFECKVFGDTKSPQGRFLWCGDLPSSHAQPN